MSFNLPPHPQQKKQKQNGLFGITIKIILSTLTEPVIYDTSNNFFGLWLLRVRENHFQ